MTDNADEIDDIPMPLLVTSGDPAGIGPEVAHKAVIALQKQNAVLSNRPLLVIGDAFLYARHLPSASEMQRYWILPSEDFIADPAYLLDKARPQKGEPWRPVFLDCGFKKERAVKPGRPDATSGERALTYLGIAIELMADEFADAVCTGPICKEVLDQEEFPFAGQTELFANVCEVPQPVMMLVGGGLRVALATIHEPLARVPRLIAPRRLKAVIRVLHKALVEDFAIAKPRIAVCGLNPHAGEGGRFGNEDRKIIRPLVESLAAKGMNIAGPLAADSVFAHAREGRYDAVLAMYHDQGLTPIKTVAFYEGVNVTLGLPIVRTAPDHGTAFDIAGKKLADARAMIEAVKLAHEISHRRMESLIGA